MGKRRRFTLMPIITLAALSLMVTVPALSSMHLYAAAPQHYATVVVHSGDTLWSIASAHTGSTSDVQRHDRPHHRSKSPRRRSDSTRRTPARPDVIKS